MLASAIIHLYSQTGQDRSCRALLDSGSKANFITDECAESLGLVRTSDHLKIVDINSIHTKATRLEPTVMCSRFSNFNLSLDFYVLPSSTANMPYQTIDLSKINIPPGIKEELADPTCSTSGSIQVLIGSEAF